MAVPSCDPAGKCPRCGYENGPGKARCLRCGQALAVPRGCSGQCTRCLISALVRPADPEATDGRTKPGPGTSI